MKFSQEGSSLLEMILIFSKMFEIVVIRGKFPFYKGGGLSNDRLESLKTGKRF